MNVNCIVTMGLVPEIKYLVSCILYRLASCTLYKTNNKYWFANGISHSKTKSYDKRVFFTNQIALPTLLLRY